MIQRPHLKHAADEYAGTGGQPVEVFVSSHLFGYTAGRNTLTAYGSTVRAVIDDLERQSPGFRFRITDELGRIRPHINVFVGEEKATSTAATIPLGTPLHILGSISGG